jgi:hypothetical protein
LWDLVSLVGLADFVSGVAAAIRGSLDDRPRWWSTRLKLKLVNPAAIDTFGDF